MSDRSQDELFRGFMSEVNSLAFADVDTTSLSERIYRAYKSQEISKSQYNELKSELADSIGLANIQYRTHEDYVFNEIDANAKIAEPYGGLSKVYVGDLLQRRDVYKDLTLYATIHFHSPDSSTPQQIEGHLKCSSIAELATVARSLSVGKTLIIDKSTLEILEARTY